jgi:DNA-binding beta-propeller fold protein YncE
MNRASAFPPASTRARAAGARALKFTALAALLPSIWACTLSQNGVVPPADTFFYPTSGAMSPTDPTGQWLYVANSNADLRFNDGTLVLADVSQAYADRHSADQLAQWGACPQADYVNPLSRSLPPTCCWDLLDASILNCDERLYTKPDATVLIGSFAAQMVWQTYCDDPCRAFHGTSTMPLACLADPNGGRILIGVRGDTSLTYVDVAPVGGQGNTSSHPTFHCTGDAVTTSMAECDQKVVDTNSSLAIESGDTQAPATTLPDEPYALTLDPGRGYLYVGHLVGSTSVQDTGGVSLFDVSGTGFIAAGEFPPAPRFVAPFGSPFPPSSSGLFGVTTINLHEPLGIAPDPDNSQLKQLFLSSRYVPLVTAMAPIGPPICAGDQNDDVLVPSGNTLNSNLVGSEMRGVEFIEPLTGSQPGYAQRAYALQRVPPDLVGFDIANDVAGTAVATPTDVLETCSSPTFLYQHDSGDGARLFVNCFDTGEVYVFDPSGPTLLTTFAVGRGPAGMVFDTARPLAYVLDFSQNDVSVVDLAPGSPTQYHVVQRLGFPSVTPR